MSLSYLRATVQFHQSKQQIKIALCIVMKIPELLVAMSHISGTSLKALTCLMTKIYQNDKKNKHILYNPMRVGV